MGAAQERGWEDEAAATALGENAPGLSGVVVDLEAILDGAC